MSFEDIEFSEEIKQGLKNMNFVKPTNVQVDTIPLMLKGHNVIVKSHTGSGKTAAFGIPISEMIFNVKVKGALVLCPTRELAVQVKDELRKMNSRTRLRIYAFYGGHGMSSELSSINKGIDILCATPGRLLDHFRNKNLDPTQFDIVVLDEADRMLDMGFIHDLKDILSQVKPKKTHLFSATLDGSVAKLIEEYIPEYKEVILPEEIIGKNIMERHVKVPRNMRINALEEVLEEAKDGRVLIFVSTKRTADFLSRKLFQLGHKTEALHGDKSQRAREMALENFKSGKRKILVATDVAARGLQVNNIEYVVNYDMAGDEDTHKHRIGRTGRMGDTGHAITFIDQEGQFISPMRGFGPRRSGSGGQSRGGFSGQQNRSRSYGDSRRDGNRSRGGYGRSDSRGRSSSGPRSSSGSRGNSRGNFRARQRN